jgi:hypothetical protein
MPYPNSPSPVTHRLNQIFAVPPVFLVSSPTRTPLAALLSGDTLADMALEFGVISSGPGSIEYSHLDAWPADQQRSARRWMIRALTAGRVVNFDWQLASTTTTNVSDLFGPGPLGIHFTSPLVYPPYAFP